MREIYRRVAAYLYTEKAGLGAETEISRQRALAEREITRLDGAQLVATFTDTAVDVDGETLPSGLAALIEGAMRFDFDSVVAEYRNPFCDDGYVEHTLRSCHVATRAVGQIDIDDDVIEMARRAMPWMSTWGWEEARQKKMAEFDRNK